MSLDRYIGWMRREALPFWLNHAASPDGLFHETLTLDGTPQHGPLRLRTGMRQAYVFAHASQLGLVDTGRGTALARRIVDTMHARAWAPDGRPGWVAKFGPDGTVLDPRRDLYDHAFALLALGYLAQATRDTRYRQWIDDTLDVIDQLQAPSGGWFQSDHQELPRSQNPHMHLFEACLGLFETTHEARHLARAGEIFGLLRGRFVDPDTGLLTEFFGPGWERAPAFRSERLDPGHLMEWTWLLRRYEHHTGHQVDALCEAFFGHALRLGRHGDFLVDEMDAAGRPLIDRQRLWPQTEVLKGLLVQSDRADDGNRRALLAQADALAGRLFDTYLAQTPRGTWRDQFTLDGRPSAADIPASTLYHLFTLAAEIVRPRRQAVESDSPSMK